MHVREVTGAKDVRRFIQLAWRINRRDPQWVPPLLMAVKSVLNRRKHPFHQHADVAYFLAEREGETVGRIAAIINHRHNEFHDDRLGFFGLFDCVDDPAVARALLECAAEWLRARGLEQMRGPVNLSTNEEHSSPGVLVEGFDTPPMVMMTHNPSYYGGLIEAAGLTKSMDLLAYWLDNPTPPERLVRGADRLAQRAGITVRSLDMKRFHQDVDAIKSVYNAAWARNWGFVPMTEAEFDYMAKDLKPIVDPDLCLLAEVDGEPVGFSLALPDFNRALRTLPSGRLFPFGFLRVLREKRRIRRLRVITLGFKPGFQHSGLGVLLYLRSWQAGAAKGYVGAEASWILESNLDMRRPLENMGALPYKRYRIYERAL